VLLKKLRFEKRNKLNANKGADWQPVKISERAPQNQENGFFHE
jgi:hypothetical protein